MKTQMERYVPRVLKGAYGSLIEKMHRYGAFDGGMISHVNPQNTCSIDFLVDNDIIKPITQSPSKLARRKRIRSFRRLFEDYGLTQEVKSLVLPSTVPLLMLAYECLTTHRYGNVSDAFKHLHQVLDLNDIDTQKIIEAVVKKCKV